MGSPFFWFQMALSSIWIANVGLLVVVDLGRSRGFAYNIYLDICKFIPNFIGYTSVFISTNCRFVGHDSN